MTDPLAAVPTRSPRAILDELAARAQRAAAAGRPRPEVALYLASGPVIAGRLLATGDDRGTAVAVLHIGGDHGAPRVATVRLDAVVAVAHDLVTPTVAVGPVPGRLAIARALASHGPAIAAGLGVALDLRVADGLDDAGLRAADAAAPLVGAILTRLASDELGRAALVMLTGVTLGAGRDGQVGKDGAVLQVIVPNDPDRAWDERALATAIDAAL